MARSARKFAQINPDYLDGGDDEGDQDSKILTKYDDIGE